MAFPGLAVADEFDITISSPVDSEETIQAALGLREAPAGSDPGDETDTDGETDDTETTEEAKAEPAKATPKQEVVAPPAKTDVDYEPPVAGESSDQRTERLERNVARIIKLNATVSNRDQHIQTLREENARLKGQLEGKPAPGKEEPAAEAKPAPKFTFPSWEKYSEEHPEAEHEDYIDARNDAREVFKDEQKSLAAEVERQRVAREQTSRVTETILAENTTRVEAFRAQHADYDEVIAASKAPLTNTMHLAMLKRDWGVPIAYHLSLPGNLAEAQRIASLEPLDQVEALIELSTTAPVAALTRSLKGTATPATPARPAAEEQRPPSVPSRRTSTAPPPIPLVAGEARTTRSLADLSGDEYIAERDRQDRERGRRR